MKSRFDTNDEQIPISINRVGATEETNHSRNPAEKGTGRKVRSHHENIITSLYSREIRRFETIGLAGVQCYVKSSIVLSKVVSSLESV